MTAIYMAQNRVFAIAPPMSLACSMKPNSLENVTSPKTSKPKLHHVGLCVLPLLLGDTYKLNQGSNSIGFSSFLNSSNLFSILSMSWSFTLNDITESISRSHILLLRYMPFRIQLAHLVDIPAIRKVENLIPWTFGYGRNQDCSAALRIAHAYF